LCSVRRIVARRAFGQEKQADEENEESGDVTRNGSEIRHIKGSEEKQIEE